MSKSRDTNCLLKLRRERTPKCDFKAVMNQILKLNKLYYIIASYD